MAIFCLLSFFFEHFFFFSFCIAIVLVCNEYFERGILQWIYGVFLWMDGWIVAFFRCRRIAHGGYGGYGGCYLLDLEG